MARTGFCNARSNFCCVVVCTYVLHAYKKERECVCVWVYKYTCAYLCVHAYLDTDMGLNIYVYICFYCLMCLVYEFLFYLCEYN